MPDFGQIILLLFAVFAAALGFACVIRFGTNCIEDKIAERKIRQADEPVKQKSEKRPQNLLYTRKNRSQKAKKETA